MSLVIQRSMKGGGITAYHTSQPEIKGRGKSRAAALADLDKAIEAAKAEKREARAKKPQAEPSLNSDS